MTALLSEAVARPPVPAERWHDLDESLGRNFLRIAEAFGDRPALIGENWSATYAELANAVRSIAARLARLPREPVEFPPRAAVLMRHDTPLFAAVLGALLAGYVVVTLNPTDPELRLRQVIADAQPVAILADPANREAAKRIRAGGETIVEIDAKAGWASARDAAEVNIPSDAAAFLIYTSGTTGAPKGVIQTHRNILHNVRRLSRGMRITHADRAVLLSALSGGQGIATAFITLMNGAALHPFATMEQGIVGLPELLEHHRITLWVSAASLFRNFVRVLPQHQRFAHLRIVRLGSEAVTPGDFAAFERHTVEHCQFMQSLSSTETGNITQLFLRHGENVPPDAVPLGDAVEDVEILLLDEAGVPVVDGEAGEIAIRGRYLSPGYWRQTDLTAARFSAEGEGVRLYRMGDLARRTGEGLFHAGRKDAQIKIRGYRIETAEVVAALERLPGVARAAVFATACSAGTPQLAACVVARGEVTAEALRGALPRDLPPYMVPAVITFLQALPLNAHGKIDVESLRACVVASQGAGLEAGQPDNARTPKTPTEKLLLGIWEDIFPHATVRPDSDFFALGGDSLSAAVAAARLHAAMGVALTLQTFTQHPVLHLLAAHADALASTPQPPRDFPAPVRVSRDGPLPLSYVEERIWNICQAHPDTTGYTMSNAYRITGVLDPALLRMCLETQIERHDILRTTYHAGRAGPMRQIHAVGQLALPMLDFSRHADPRGDATAYLAAEARRPFDLSRLPLVRFSLARLAQYEHLLLRVSHHITSDAWSWRMFFTELAALYEARAAGRPEPLCDDALGYADYAAWQRRTLDRSGAAYRASVEWWGARLSPAPPPLALPFARRKPLPKADMASGFLSFQLEAGLLERADAYARRHGTTAFTLRLAILARLLSTQTGQRDLVVGAYVTNRQSVQTQQIFGDFANLATLRLAGDSAGPFAETLRTAGEAVQGMQANSEIPYEQLRTDLRARRPAVQMPEIRAILAITDRIAPLRFAGLELSWLERVDGAPWGFTLAFPSSGADCRATFDPRLHDPEAVRAFIGRYVEMLSEIVR